MRAALVDNHDQTGALDNAEWEWSCIRSGHAGRQTESFRIVLPDICSAQLQQLGRIMQEVDEACRSEDVALLSDVLEKRALPWLDGLIDSLGVWQETMALGPDSEYRPT